MNTLQMYIRYIGLSFRTQLEYKGSFIMLALANAANTAMELFTMYLFFGRFGGLEGWVFPEVALFYGMAVMAFAICEAWMRGFDTFHQMVKQAEFDRVLLRPRSTVLQILGSNFQLLRFGRLAVGICVLLWSLSTLGIHWNAAQWALFVASILGGALLFSAIILAQATSCFWTVETLEIFNTVTYGGIETCQYPLSIYEEGLKKFFMYIVPLAAINFWPCSVLLNKGYVSPWLAYLSPVIGPVFFAAGIFLWRFGVRHYRSTGS